jgi:hypothetical protein
MTMVNQITYSDLGFEQLRAIKATVEAKFDQTTHQTFSEYGSGRERKFKTTGEEYFLTLTLDRLNSAEVKALIDCAIGLERNRGIEGLQDADFIARPNEKIVKPDNNNKVVNGSSRFAELDLGMPCPAETKS